jgi:cytochrome P450
MVDLFSDEARRDPYPAYRAVLARSPMLFDPGAGLWMVFDFEGVRRVLTDHETFSSGRGPDWLIFKDPPRHTKLRAIISKAFTPRSVVALEPRIRGVVDELLDRVVDRGEMDLAVDFAIPLPLIVIAEMLGIPAADRERFRRWADVMLAMSYTIVCAKGDEAERAMADFIATTGEMNAYLGELLARRRAEPRDDLLTRLVTAEVDGERLTQAEILGFFQLLLLAGSETTTNLINNAILCFVAHPAELARVRNDPALLPSAIEEVLRYRSPVQWMYRIPRREVELHGQTVPAGKLVLAMIGAANRDPSKFAEPDRFDVGRDPNPHLAFGHGNHFCLGAPLARLEARVALTAMRERLGEIRLASDAPWEPRRGMHVHGPARLGVRFGVGARGKIKKGGERREF